jgi:branched-chain amino acid transport system substrate-binding protein
MIAGPLIVSLVVGIAAVIAAPRTLTIWQTNVPRTLCLATDLPTSGDAGALGLPVQNAVDLAVEQHRDLGSGYTLTAKNFDDSKYGEPDSPTGAYNVEQMVKDPCVVGMVGPFDSSVAWTEIPVAATAGLVMISPANTNPALTLRQFANGYEQDFDQIHPPGTRNNYFRITSNDVTQGLVDANFAFDTLGARRVYVVNGPNDFGVGLASFFTEPFQVKGGIIVGTDRLVPGDSSGMALVAAKIVAQAPDAVFYGGTTDDGGCLLKALLAERGFAGPFIAGDAIAGDPTCLAQATAQGGIHATIGLYASNPTRDLSTFTSGRSAQFIHAYSARYPIKDLTPYAADAYDAAMVLVTAIRNLIHLGQDVTRSALIDQVQNIQYSGVTGPIRFDSNGDIAHGIFSIYQVRSGNWVYLKQVTA